MTLSTTDLDLHWPSIHEDDEQVLEDRRWDSDRDRWGQPKYDVADLAVRTCRCGIKIDGFDEYVAHLKEVAERER